ncbi:MAG TPA: 3-deoxy-7-phosphoheptulonate synthase [Cyclobacteriaceae bacterium]|nr:3-deoxy-7-phosphoheptulonate synthase [Cyclobacteriaceae bacterium]
MNCELPDIPQIAGLKLVSRTMNPAGTIIDIDGICIGDREFVVMAGPCAVESEHQLYTTAMHICGSGAKILRGGAFKPRTSPYSFQGLEKEGLVLLAKIRKETGMPVVTEAMDTRQLEMVMEFTDILQIGSRNMQNFPLLKEAGMCDKPILLKRGMSSTLEEFLLAAEYILKEGNTKVILCERGIRTFEPAYRNTMDLNAVPMLKKLSHLPVIVDPSHGTGYSWMVPYLAKAALAVGADGLLVEVHFKPEDALCDGPQSLTPPEFDQMMRELAAIAPAVGREMGLHEPNFI